MAKWVTIRRKEFRRLQDAARQARAPEIEVPEGYTVLAKSYYEELYQCQCRLQEIDGEDNRWRAEITAGLNIAVLNRDAELGALVRQMQEGYVLLRVGNVWKAGPHNRPFETYQDVTPEAALRGLMKASPAE